MVHAAGLDSSMRTSVEHVARPAHFRRRVAADGEVELDVDAEELERGVAAGVPRLRALEVDRQADAEQFLVVGVDADAGGGVGEDQERGELQQHVEVEPAACRVGDEQELRRRLDLEAAAELHGVRRDGEVRLDRRRDARRRCATSARIGRSSSRIAGTCAGGVNPGWNPPTDSTKYGSSPQLRYSAVSPDSSITPSSRESYSEPTMSSVPASRSSTPRTSRCSSSTGASRSGSTASIDASTTMQSLREGDGHAELPDQHVADAPADLGDRADDRVAVEQREVLVDLGDEQVGVAQEVLGEQDGVGGAVAQAERQRLGVDGAVEGEQAAEPAEREPEPERDAREAQRQRGEEGEPVGVAGEAGVDDREGVDADGDHVEAEPADVAAGLLDRYSTNPPPLTGPASSVERDPRRRCDAERRALSARGCRRIRGTTSDVPQPEALDVGGEHQQRRRSGRR